MKILRNLGILLIGIILVSSCKTSKDLKYITSTEVLADTLIRHEVETIVLPQRNVVILERPCLEENLSSINQIIENEHSTVTIGSEGENIRIEVDIDSIVNARIMETRIKDQVEKIEVPIEVPYPVKNKLNWYLVMYAIGSTIVIFRKPIFYLIKKLILPIP